MRVAGVHSILVTPFTSREGLDLDGLSRVTEATLAAGVVGVVALGVLGEADKLSDRERDLVSARVVDTVAGRAEVTIGVSHPSTHVVRDRAVAAERAGATAVMVAPTSTDRDEVRLIQEAISIPVVIQDYPDTSGVRLTVEYLASFANAVIKLEDPPTPNKIALLREVAPLAPILAGRGGLMLLHDLAAGADGVMTGFSFPELLVEIVTSYSRGDVKRAQASYEEALPILVFEGQPGISVALRKEILRRRGLIADATVRAPCAQIAAATLESLNNLVAL